MDALFDLDGSYLNGTQRKVWPRKALALEDLDSRGVYCLGSDIFFDVAAHAR